MWHLGGIITKDRPLSDNQQGWLQLLQSFAYIKKKRFFVQIKGPYNSKCK